jgi:hypothetical protein
MLLAARLATEIRELHGLPEPHLVVIVTEGLDKHPLSRRYACSRERVPAIGSPLVWGASFSTCLGPTALIAPRVKSVAGMVAVRYVEIAAEESVLARPLDRNVEAGRAPTRVGAHENLGFAKHEE